MATHVAVLRDGRVEQFGPPDELLLKPQTTFVATFLGTPAGNLVPVTGNGEDFVFNCVNLAPTAIAPDLDTAQLLYRAQDITVGRRDGRPTVKATYAESAPIAGQSMVTCLIGDLRVTAIVDGFFRAEPGAEIDLCFLRDPDAVFDADGRRVTE
jgi:iron(III) transport system ATP-binding protein